MSTEMNITHAKKLRFLRKVADKKQVEVAEALNMSQQAYSLLENGDTAFADATIEKLAAFFEISPADFEKPIESFYFGSNNNSNNFNNTVDLKFIETIQKAQEQNETLLHLLLEEKNARIKEMEAEIKRLKG